MADEIERRTPLTVVEHVTRESLLEELARIDALLDILAEYDETTLMMERESLVWMLSDD